MNISIRIAKTEDDLEKIFKVRETGNRRYALHKGQLSDEYDYASNATLFLAEDDKKNPVGTMRILDRRYGQIELDKFIKITSLLTDQDKECVEVSRLWVPKHLKSKLIKFLLWKTAFRYCQINQLITILISIRPSSARFYQRLFFFEPTGPGGIFKNPLLENLEYHIYKSDLSRTMELLKTTKHPLYDFFCIEKHPDLIIDELKSFSWDERKKFHYSPKL